MAANTLFNIPTVTDAEPAIVLCAVVEPVGSFLGSTHYLDLNLDTIYHPRSRTIIAITNQSELCVAGYRYLYLVLVTIIETLLLSG